MLASLLQLVKGISVNSLDILQFAFSGRFMRFVPRVRVLRDAFSREERYGLALRFFGIAEEDLNARFAISIMHSGFFYSRSGPPWMSLPPL
uniref:Uncharacterized protein n=1 Tax=Fagus sylvatica TaxID=28930 RepID=A0A2N9FMQ5_FAGSY